MKKICLNNQQTLQLVDNNTVLVVVDVNKPKLTECEELLIMTNTIVLLYLIDNQVKQSLMHHYHILSPMHLQL